MADTEIKAVGTKREVFDGLALKTAKGSRGLTAADLMLNKVGKVVSRKASEAAARKYARSGIRAPTVATPAVCATEIASAVKEERAAGAAQLEEVAEKLQSVTKAAAIDRAKILAGAAASAIKTAEALAEDAMGEDTTIEKQITAISAMKMAQATLQLSEDLGKVQEEATEDITEVVAEEQSADLRDQIDAARDEEIALLEQIEATRLYDQAQEEAIEREEEEVMQMELEMLQEQLADQRAAEAAEGEEEDPSEFENELFKTVAQVTESKTGDIGQGFFKDMQKHATKHLSRGAKKLAKAGADRLAGMAMERLQGGSLMRHRRRIAPHRGTLKSSTTHRRAQEVARQRMIHQAKVNRAHR